MPRNQKGRLGSPEERLKRKLVYEGDCWIWTGSKNKKGYGLFMGPEDKNVAVHRFSYANFIGPIPNGLYVLHKCDVRSCVNPDHLFLGTQDDNMKDAQRKGRLKYKLTDQQREKIKQDPRKLLEIAADYSISFQLVSRIKLYGR